MSRDAFLILHGIENHRPPEHWQFWLAGRLVDRGHRVLYPGLPEPDAPRVDAWTAALETNLAELGGDGRRTVVAHSLACSLWLRCAGAIDPATRPDRLLLVAPPADASLPPAAAAFAVGMPDTAGAGETRVVVSDADPYDPDGVATTLAQSLGAALDVLGGAGHITPDDGYGRWPALEAWCVGEAHAVLPA